MIRMVCFNVFTTDKEREEMWRVVQRLIHCMLPSTFLPFPYAALRTHAYGQTLVVECFTHFY